VKPDFVLDYRTDSEILGYALETLCNIMSNEVFTEGACRL